VKHGYYLDHSHELKEKLLSAVPRDVLVALHQRSALRHLFVAGRQYLFLGLATAALWQGRYPWLWIPAVFFQGLTVFNFTILLHEVVHHAVFERPRRRTEGLLGWVYALPSGISRTQFTRWHLDHHAELGSTADDPKRAHLSPKRNARWYKALYCTPALFPIYFRAAAREAATYTPELQRQIRLERRVTIALHLAALAAAFFFGGFWVALRVYAIPVFFVFPIAFTLNRLGQHYNVNPENPANWTTLVRGSLVWDFLFLDSNYHLEHHYFPGVPMYHLPRLQRVLDPFYAREGMEYQTYGKLLRGWFLENRAPHTDWRRDLA